MSTKIKLATVPADLLPFLSARESGESRFYRKDGPEEEVARWFDELSEHFNGLISPGGAAMFAPDDVGRTVEELDKAEARLESRLFTESEQDVRAQTRRTKTEDVSDRLFPCRCLWPGALP
jgi:hypothetical protein